MVDDIEFPDGLYVKKPHPNAPDFVKCDISINKEKFIAFLQSKDGEYVNLTTQVSRSTGNWYTKVDNFQPKPKDDEKYQSDYESGGNLVKTDKGKIGYDEDVPF